MDDAMDDLSEALGNAIEAAMKALLAMILVLATIMARALQAVFTLARPAAMLGTIVALGYTSCVLFITVLAQYGGDLPAMFLALTSVIIAPTALLVMAGNYGTWGIALGSAALEFLAHLGIERAPPVVLALTPVVVLSATTLYFLARGSRDVPESTEGVEHEQQERDERVVVDRDDEFDHLHGNEELRSDQPDHA
jgi:hypothetical protein